MKTLLKAEDVFTPKEKSVNNQMYIERLELEQAFKKAIRKPKHIIMYGESGSGKTWLYKKIFSELNIFYEVLNSATVNSTGSISKAMEALCSRISPVKRTGYDETKAAEINAYVAKGSLDHTNKFNFSTQESYFELLSMLNKKANGKPAFLVIDNLEHIVKNKTHLQELSSLLLYLDDEAYAEKNVRILLVGTLSNIRDYFSSIDESQTLINRAQELPEVSALRKNQVDFLVRKGFFDLLKMELSPEEDFKEPVFLNLISWYSINIPQYVHEICLEIAMCAEGTNRISYQLCAHALKNWTQEALISENSRIEQNINSKETKHGRRNQVIYTIGFLTNYEFSNSEVEEKLRTLFPESTNSKTINVSAILGELSNGTHPLIRKIPNGSKYRVWDPKIRIMIRWMMTKKDNEVIEIKKLDDSIKI